MQNTIIITTKNTITRPKLMPSKPLPKNIMKAQNQIQQRNQNLNQNPKNLLFWLSLIPNLHPGNQATQNPTPNPHQRSQLSWQNQIPPNLQRKNQPIQNLIQPKKDLKRIQLELGHHQR